MWLFVDMKALDSFIGAHWPIPNLFDIRLYCMEKHHFWMYIVACWSSKFYDKSDEVESAIDTSNS